MKIKLPTKKTVNQKIADLPRGKLSSQDLDNGDIVFSWQFDGDKFPSVHCIFEGQRDIIHLYYSDKNKSAGPIRNMNSYPKSFLLELTSKLKP